MLLCREHEDDEDELGGKEHLDEEALRDACAACEGCIDVEWAGEEGGDDGCCAHAGYELGDEDYDGAYGCYGTDEEEGEGHLVELLVLDFVKVEVDVQPG